MRIRMIVKRIVVTSSEPVIRIRFVTCAPKPPRDASVPRRIRAACVKTSIRQIWRRITDTRRRRDNRMRQQNLTYGELTATPVADPSDSGFQGDPPFSRPETSTSRPDMAVIAAPS